VGGKAAAESAGRAVDGTSIHAVRIGKASMASQQMEDQSPPIRTAIT